MKILNTVIPLIINPIPKAYTSDPRDPLLYRGITLSPVTYKVYCTILNERLVSWNEQQNSIVDEQNGFRKNSTLDHLTTLTSIVETRKMQESQHIIMHHIFVQIVH